MKQKPGEVVSCCFTTDGCADRAEGIELSQRQVTRAHQRGVDGFDAFADPSKGREPKTRMLEVIFGLSIDTAALVGFIA